MDIKEMIGSRIKEIRNSKGMTQEKLSEIVGINPKYLSGIERGTENPTLNTILKIVESLNVSLDEVFGGIEIEDAKKRRHLVEDILNRADGEQLKSVYRILSAVIKK